MKYTDSDGQELRVEIDCFGNKWYYNSKYQYHRLDGPACEYVGGSYDWYKNNKSHRIGGPASYDSNFIHYKWWVNDYEWCVNGKQVDIYYICG